MSQESIVPSYDHSWIVSVFVDELDSSYSIRVKDSTRVSSLITDLINRIHLKFDWLEFGLWCETKKIWLLPKSSTLSTFSLQSDSKVRFVKRFRMMNIQLPDLQIRQMLLDFSKTLFETNRIVCRKMGIRHHEELSFQYRTTESSKYRLSSLMRIKKKQTFSSQQDMLRSNWSLRRNTNQFSPLPIKRDVNSFFRSLSSQPHSNDSPKLRQRTTATPSSPVSLFSTDELNNEKSLDESIYFESFENSKLTNSPDVPYEQAIINGDIFIFKTYRERSKLRFPWMISEFTLMEQGIDNFDNVILLLRFKYHNYFYLNEKYDGIRINQIFHQACWSVLSNETDCSEDEALILGGILMQVKKSTEQRKIEDVNGVDKVDNKDLDDEINTILDKLHLELLGRCEDKLSDTGIIINGPVLLRKSPNYFFKSFEKYFAEMKEDGIHLFLKQNSESNLRPIEVIPIKGNEIELHVKLSKKEYFILEILNLQNDSDSLVREEKKIDKFKFKFHDKTEFIRWSTACRLLAKFIDFTNIANYQYEYNVVTNIVDVRQPILSLPTVSVGDEDEKVNLSNFLSPKFNKPFRKKYILEILRKFQTSCSHYNSIQSKIAFIKCWLTLHNAGICYFQVSLDRNPDKDLIGIGYDRLLLANSDTGKLKRIWELSKLVTWNTNWELEYMILEFAGEKLNIGFPSISECQTFHEYLGGYFFIMMRNSEKYSDLSEKAFRKLTARNISKA